MPQPSAMQLDAIRKVLASSSSAERPKLVFALPDANLARKYIVLLFYGEPAQEGMRRGGAAYRVIGTCNLLYLDGAFFAAPGDGFDCAHWKPSAVDRIVMRR